MQASTNDKLDVKGEIVAFKQKMRPLRAELKRAFAEVKDFVTRAADKIRSDIRDGHEGDGAPARPARP